MAEAIAGYGIVPAHPPLPTASNFPFQPDCGNHSSILMSESELGVSVAVTGQNAGRVANAPAPLPLPAPAGGTNAPAATTAAEVTFAFVSFMPARDSHGVAAQTFTCKRIAIRQAP